MDYDEIERKNSKLNITYGAHTIGIIRGEPSTGQQKIIVGKYCSIAGKVLVFTEPSHNTDFISTYAFHHKASKVQAVHPPITTDKPFLHRGELVIGNDVWLGWGVRLFTGLTIGDGAVVGAFTPVTKSIPPYSIAIGQPIRILRKRFPDEDIKFLLELQWWNFPDNEVASIVHLLQNKDMNLLKEWAIKNGRWNGV